MLSSFDFSIVVQGPIHSSVERPDSQDITIRCLESIRRFFPQAEIILSTWKSARANGLDCDVLITSEDPGALPYCDTSPHSWNNVNRQLVSSRAGLASASRPYALKMRGDLLLKSDNLLDFEHLSGLPGTRRLLHSKILIAPYHTRNPRRYPLLFHYSDIIQAGRTEDLRKLWSVPLAPEPETTRWREGQTPRFFAPIFAHHHQRVWPEQYLILSFLSLYHGPVFLDHPWQISPRKTLLSEKILLENFRVLQLEQIGVCFPERLFPLDPDVFFYRGADWDRLSLAYSKQPSRLMAQADLLLMTYWRFLEFCLRNYLRNNPVRATPVYRWLHDCYRRLFPLS